MFDALERAIQCNSEILELDHRGGQKDLGLVTHLETAEERRQFALALFAVVLDLHRFTGEEEDWLKAWAPELRAHKEEMFGLGGEDNPILAATRSNAVWVPKGVDVKDEQKWHSIRRSGGEQTRYLGLPTYYFSSYARKLRDQWPHLDSSSEATDLREMHRIAMFQSFSPNNQGTYVGFVDDLFRAKSQVIVEHPRLVGSLFRGGVIDFVPGSNKGSTAGKNIVVYSEKALRGGNDELRRFTQMAHIQTFYSTNMATRLEFLAIRALTTHMLKQMLARAETPVAHLKLPPGTWAFVDQAQTAHGRYRPRGDLLGVDL